MSAFIDPDLTVKASSHSCFAIITKLADSQVNILTLDCVEEKHLGSSELTTKLELPGGSSLEGEDLQQTLRREVSAEISHQGKPLVFRNQKEVMRFQKPGDACKGGGVHTQYFFLVDIEGSQDFRIQTKTEADGAVLGLPVYRDAAEFLDSPIAKKRHKEAVRKLLELLARVNAKFATRYQAYLPSEEDPGNHRKVNHRH